MAVKRLKFEVYLNLIKVVASIAFLMTAVLGAFAPLEISHFQRTVSTPEFLTGQTASARTVLPQNHALPAGTIIE